MTAVAIDFPGHGFSSHFTNCTHYDPLDACKLIENYKTLGSVIQPTQGFMLNYFSSWDQIFIFSSLYSPNNASLWI